MIIEVTDLPLFAQIQGELNYGGNGRIPKTLERVSSLERCLGCGCVRGKSDNPFTCGRGICLDRAVERTQEILSDWSKIDSLEGRLWDIHKKTFPSHRRRVKNLIFTITRLREDLNEQRLLVEDLRDELYGTQK